VLLWKLRLIIHGPKTCLLWMEEKLAITRESAKNLVNRRLKNTNKGRLFSKQETDEGMKVGVSRHSRNNMTLF
jgi:hypothetical protein